MSFSDSLESESKNEETLKLQGISLRTGLTDFFHYKTKYVKMIPYADDMKGCQYNEGLSCLSEWTGIPWDYKQWKSKVIILQKCYKILQKAKSCFKIIAMKNFCWHVIHQLEKKEGKKEGL